MQLSLMPVLFLQEFFFLDRHPPRAGLTLGQGRTTRNGLGMSRTRSSYQFGGVEDPGTITGFANGFSRDADPERVRVWAPVLGEQAGPQLEALFELLQPQDVYPVLPFPARDPRRADDLVLEHRSLLFERFEVDPNNFLYVSESNPFDTYRALAGLDVRYRSLLSPVGVPEIVVSTHASKTLGIGVCLAAIEREMPVVNAGPSRYGIAEIPEAEWVENASTLSCIWLHGTPFR